MVTSREFYRVMRRKINELFDDIVKYDGTVHKGHYHANDAGKCLRSTFFKYVVDSSPTTRTIARGRILVSMMLEAIALDALKELGYDTKVHFTKKIDDDIYISGEVDAINEREVVEIKTVTPTAIQYLPFTKDFYQINTYLWLSGRKHGTIIYLKSDNPAKYYTYQVQFREDKLQETFNYFRELHKYVTTNTIPPKTSNVELCKVCVFRKLCQRIDSVQKQPGQ